MCPFPHFTFVTCKRVQCNAHFTFICVYFLCIHVTFVRLLRWIASLQFIFFWKLCIFKSLTARFFRTSSNYIQTWKFVFKGGIVNVFKTHCWFKARKLPQKERLIFMSPRGEMFKWRSSYNGFIKKTPNWYKEAREHLTKKNTLNKIVILILSCINFLTLIKFVSEWLTIYYWRRVEYCTKINEAFL